MGKQNGQRYHFLYKTTNTINGKYYYGVHSTYNLSDGYLGSGKRLKRSIEKYGIENFKCEILEFFKSREEVLKKEIEIVNETCLQNSLCMNLQPGGGGGWSVEQQSKNGKKGNKKMKWLRKNDKKWLENLKTSQSEGQKKSYENGRIKITPNWTGKKHKEETKKKIGEKNSIKQKGENNSQFGTCWITNGVKNKKVKKEEIKKYDGWKKGRTL